MRGDLTQAQQDIQNQQQQIIDRDNKIRRKKNKITNLRQDIQQITTERDRKQQTVNRLRNQRNNLQNQLRQNPTPDDVQRIQQEKTRVENELQNARQDITNYQGQLTQVTGDLNRHQNEIAQLRRDTQQQITDKDTKIQGKKNKIGRLKQNIQQITGERDQKQQIIDRLKNERDNLRNQLQQNPTQEERQQLQQEKTRVENELQNAQQAITNYQDQLTQATEELTRKQNTITQLQAQDQEKDDQLLNLDAYVSDLEEQLTRVKEQKANTEQEKLARDNQIQVLEGQIAQFEETQRQIDQEKQAWIALIEQYKQNVGLQQEEQNYLDIVEGIIEDRRNFEIEKFEAEQRLQERTREIEQLYTQKQAIREEALQEIREKQEEVDAQQQHIREIENQLSRLQENKTENIGQITELREKLQTAQADFREAQNEIQKLENEKHKLLQAGEEEYNRIKEERDQQLKTIKQQQNYIDGLTQEARETTDRYGELLQEMGNTFNQPTPLNTEEAMGMLKQFKHNEEQRRDQLLAMEQLANEAQHATQLIEFALWHTKEEIEKTKALDPRVSQAFIQKLNEEYTRTQRVLELTSNLPPIEEGPEAMDDYYQSIDYNEIPRDLVPFLENLHTVHRASFAYKQNILDNQELIENALSDTAYSLQGAGGTRAGGADSEYSMIGPGGDHLTPKAIFDEKIKEAQKHSEDYTEEGLLPEETPRPMPLETTDVENLQLSLRGVKDLYKFRRGMEENLTPVELRHAVKQEQESSNKPWSEAEAWTRMKEDLGILARNHPQHENMLNQIHNGVFEPVREYVEEAQVSVAKTQLYQDATYNRADDDAKNLILSFTPEELRVVADDTFTHNTTYKAGKQLSQNLYEVTDGTSHVVNKKGDPDQFEAVSDYFKPFTKRDKDVGENFLVTALATAFAPEYIELQKDEDADPSHKEQIGYAQAKLVEIIKYANAKYNEMKDIDPTDPEKKQKVPIWEKIEEVMKDNDSLLKEDIQNYMVTTIHPLRHSLWGQYATTFTQGRKAGDIRGAEQSSDIVLSARHESTKFIAWREKRAYDVISELHKTASGGDDELANIIPTWLTVGPTLSTIGDYLTTPKTGEITPRVVNIARDLGWSENRVQDLKKRFRMETWKRNQKGDWREYLQKSTEVVNHYMNTIRPILLPTLKENTEAHPRDPFRVPDENLEIEEEALTNTTIGGYDIPKPWIDFDFEHRSRSGRMIGNINLEQYYTPVIHSEKAEGVFPETPSIDQEDSVVVVEAADNTPSLSDPQIIDETPTTPHKIMIKPSDDYRQYMLNASRFPQIDRRNYHIYAPKPGLYLPNWKNRY